MNDPAPRPVADHFLQPGDFRFCGEHTRLRTLLGSCVSITLWHPQRKIGGMCHYILPSRGRPRGRELDGRYADEAVALFLREVNLARARPEEFEVKLFGGGNMFPHLDRARLIDVGRRNIETGRELLLANGFRIVTEHLAGTGHRNVIFELWTGDVWIKHVERPAPLEPLRRQR